MSSRALGVGAGLGGTLLSLWIGACGSSGPSAAEVAAAAAKRAEETERAAHLEDRRKAREAEQQAAEAAEAERQRRIDTLTVLPDKLPKRLDKACKGVGEALDGLMKRHYADEPDTLEKWKMASRMQLPVIAQSCEKSRSLEVAACQKTALEQAPVEFKKTFSDLLAACTRKYGHAEGPT